MQYGPIPGWYYLRAVSPPTFHGPGGPTLVTSERLSQQRQPALRSLIGFERRTFVAAFLAAITLSSGILNLISVVGGASQPKMLAAVFPLEFSRLSRTLTILIGFALIASSLNIYKRKKRAWAVVLALSSLSTILHLTRELNYRNALLSSALLLLLLFTRDTFTVKSRRPDLRSGLLHLLVSAVVTVSYDLTGCWLLDKRHFGMNFRIGNAIAATFRFVSLSGDPRLLPHTQYGHWFLDSLNLITLTAGVYSGFALFRRCCTGSVWCRANAQLPGRSFNDMPVRRWICLSSGRISPISSRLHSAALSPIGWRTTLPLLSETLLGRKRRSGRPRANSWKCAARTDGPSRSTRLFPISCQCTSVSE